MRNSANALVAAHRSVNYNTQTSPPVASNTSHATPATLTRPAPAFCWLGISLHHKSWTHIMLFPGNGIYNYVDIYLLIHLTWRRYLCNIVLISMKIIIYLSTYLRWRTSRGSCATSSWRGAATWPRWRSRWWTPCPTPSRSSSINTQRSVLSRDLPT